TLIPALRKNHPEPQSLTTAIAELHTHGIPVNWEALSAGRPAQRVDLPTYPFQHQHYWEDTAVVSSAADLGQDPVTHSLLATVVDVADGDTMMFTGLLSLRTSPWLADHAITGTVLVPGTAFVELALEAAGHLGFGQVEELTLQQPLLVPDHGGTQIQVAVGPADDTGRHPVTIYSRADEQAVGSPSVERSWTRHATGALGTADDIAPAWQAPGEWPPPNATPVDVEDLYTGLARRGYEYGPVFQGLRAAWRHGNDIYADVQLPEGTDVSQFGIHPALLDAALHPVLLTTLDQDTGDIQLPFSWTGVTLHRNSATAVRVHVTPSGNNAVALSLSDPAGAPVASVGSLSFRPISAGQLAASGGPQNEQLFQLDWTPGTAPAQAAPAADGSWAVLGGGELGAVFPAAAAYPDLASLQLAITDGGAAPGMVLAPCPAPPAAALPGAAHTTTHQALALVQDWLADDRLISSHLVIMTCGAVATRPGEHIADLATAPVWGLLRSAQSENPGRLTVLDTDGRDTSYHGIPAALAAGEPQIALRDGVLFTPRLARVSPDGLLAPPPDTPAWRLEVT
ncbi:MAG TPA: polyketide synthase dehydratase domain-containing protein, partial [Streptosporangiaceae bacterium]|nr:polyketide synthase dehydratase domain-containing protein [Streptosporangiaceae bacterium]